MITSLAYFGATSPDYKEWESFGPKVLGCELVESGPDGAVRLRIDEMSYRLAIHPGEANGVAYIGWETTGVEDVQQMVERLQAYGIEAKLCVKYWVFIGLLTRLVFVMNWFGARCVRIRLFMPVEA